MQTSGALATVAQAFLPEVIQCQIDPRAHRPPTGAHWRARLNFSSPSLTCTTSQSSAGAWRSSGKMATWRGTLSPCSTTSMVRHQAARCHIIDLAQIKHLAVAPPDYPGSDGSRQCSSSGVPYRPCAVFSIEETCTKCVSQNTANSRGKVGTTRGFSRFSACAPKQISHLDAQDTRKYFIFAASCESRVSGNWRIVFVLKDGDAYVVNMRIIINEYSAAQSNTPWDIHQESLPGSI